MMNPRRRGRQPETAGERADVRNDRLRDEVPCNLLPVTPHAGADFLVGTGQRIDARCDALKFTGLRASLQASRRGSVLPRQENLGERQSSGS